eukprot:5580358-Prymnesium_polylepis.1
MSVLRARRTLGRARARLTTLATLTLRGRGTRPGDCSTGPKAALSAHRACAQVQNHARRIFLGDQPRCSKENSAILRQPVQGRQGQDQGSGLGDGSWGDVW